MIPDRRPIPPHWNGSAQGDGRESAYDSPARQRLLESTLPPRQGESPLENAWRIVRDGKWIILAATLLCAAAAVLFSLLREEQYTATSSILFGTAAEAIVGESNTDSRPDASRQAATNESLLSLDVVAAGAARRLRVDPDDVENAIAIDASQDSDIVDILATTPDARLSARMANAYGNAFIDFRRRSSRAQIQVAIDLARTALAGLSETDAAGQAGDTLRSRVDQLERVQGLQTGGAQLVQQAPVPESPSSPKPVRDGIFGALLGAILGLALAALRARRDHTVRNADELEAVFRRPVLAQIPESTSVGEDGDLSVHSQEAEAFRILRASLRSLSVTGEVRSLLVGSARPGEGKTTVARRLAETMAAMGDSVILVEADMHRPRSRTTGAELSGRGLSAVLIGHDLEESIEWVTLDNLRSPRALAVLPSGPLPPNPTELIESPRMRDVLEDLQSRFDMVIIDSPPLALMSDTFTLVDQVSGLIVVSALNKTSVEAVRDLQQLIGLLRGRLLGVVANFAPRNTDRAAEAYYYSRG